MMSLITGRTCSAHYRMAGGRVVVTAWFLIKADVCDITAFFFSWLVSHQL